MKIEERLNKGRLKTNQKKIISQFLRRSNVITREAYCGCASHIHPQRIFHMFVRLSIAFSNCQVNIEIFFPLSVFSIPGNAILICIEIGMEFFLFFFFLRDP